VSCELTKGVLHGYLDNELDAARAAEFERHIESCRECASALGSGEALRASLQGPGLYERAPAVLRDRVRAQLKSAAKARQSRMRNQLWRWLAVAASHPHRRHNVLAFAAFAGADAAHDESACGGDDRRACAIRCRLDILRMWSRRNQHTVRPWFDGKLDFIPPVKDYTEEGFTLVGWPADALTGRSVAALVYTRRKHYVNVFVWPTQDVDTPIHPPGSRQGYNWVHWRHKGWNSA